MGHKICYLVVYKCGSQLTEGELEGVSCDLGGEGRGGEGTIPRPILKKTKTFQNSYIILFIHGI